MARYLILAAVLAGGCEQLKSPQKLRDLEARVDKLSDDVAVLKGEKPKQTAQAGEGSGEGSEGSGEGSAGSGEHTEAAAGSGEHAAAEPGGEAAGSGEPAEPSARSAGAGEHGDGSGGEHGDGSGSARPPVDPVERGYAELRDVVARTRRGEMVNPPGPRTTTPPEQRPRPAPSRTRHWSYEGANGPPTWGTLDPAWRTCMVGKAQSPIDIEPRASNAAPITFHYKPTASLVFDNGHTLQVDLAPGSTIEIDGAVYQLVQFHFHMPSEHTIAGERYPLEVHLVHHDDEGRIAVVGVLYDAGAESRPLDAIWSRWPRKTPGEDRTRKSFDPSDLLPETRSVFRYTGSLTTPPCTEGVMWSVMRRTMTDSKAHLDGFARHYAHNARDVQPRNDRRIE